MKFKELYENHKEEISEANGMADATTAKQFLEDFNYRVAERNLNAEVKKLTGLDPKVKLKPSRDGKGIEASSPNLASKTIPNLYDKFEFYFFGGTRIIERKGKLLVGGNASFQWEYRGNRGSNGNQFARLFFTSDGGLLNYS